MTNLLTTTSNAFRYPTDVNNGADFSVGIADLASDVDGMWVSGALSALPSAGKVGRRYFATDTDARLVDTGSGWVPTAALAMLGGSGTLVNGQLAVVNGGDTVALPAPTRDAMIAVQANAGVTSVSTVTITASSMFGAGVADGTTSVVLGAPGATLLFQADGTTRWRIVAGQIDTGWTTMGLETGVTAQSGNPGAEVRQIGDRVEVRGQVVLGSSFATPIASSNSVGLPYTATSNYPGLRYDGSNWNVAALLVGPSGSDLVIAYENAFTAGDVIDLAAIGYRVA